MDYKETFEHLLDLERNLIFLKGFCDVINKTVTSNEYWVILGKPLDDMIKEYFDNSEFEYPDGEYEYEICTRITPTYYEQGRVIEPSYLEPEYEKFTFIQTIQQRERDKIITDVLDFDTLFN